MAKINGTYITYQGTYQLPVAAVNFSQFLFATKSGTSQSYFTFNLGSDFLWAPSGPAARDAFRMTQLQQGQ